MNVVLCIILFCWITAVWRVKFLICTHAWIRTDTLAVGHTTKQVFRYLNSLDKNPDLGYRWNRQTAWTLHLLSPIPSLGGAQRPCFQANPHTAMTNLPAPLVLPVSRAPTTLGVRCGLTPKRFYCHTYVGLEWAEWKEGTGRRGPEAAACWQARRFKAHSDLSVKLPRSFKGARAALMWGLVKEKHQSRASGHGSPGGMLFLYPCGMSREQEFLGKDTVATLFVMHLELFNSLQASERCDSRSEVKSN